MGQYKKSFVEALLDIFPDIGLDEFKFTELGKKHNFNRHEM